MPGNLAVSSETSPHAFMGAASFFACESMSQAYAHADENALRRPGVVAERLRNTKATAIANVLGKSDSWVDKVRNGESGVLLTDIQPLLDALGLKAVDKSKVCVDKDIYTSLKNIAGAALEAPQKLEWE